MRKKRYPAQALDLLLALHPKQLPPFMYAKIQLEGHIREDQLVRALSLTSRSIPQLLRPYDWKRNCWSEKELPARSAIVLLEKGEPPSPPIWDLTLGAQIKIEIIRDRNSDTLQIAMSHILSDGGGFKQLLYLLCQMYNGVSTTQVLPNQRLLLPFLPPATLRERIPFHDLRNIHSSDPAKIPLPLGGGGIRRYQNLFCEMDAPSFQALKQKAKAKKVFLNDVLLSAYAKVLSQFTGKTQINLPCPVDLRQHLSQEFPLTITNFTGNYKCSLQIPKGIPFDTIIEKANLAMKAQKKGDGGLATILLLNSLYRKSPLTFTRHLSRLFFHVPPISYTNVGLIDEKALSFSGTNVLSCSLCGTFRPTPGFQLAISTFQNVCTFSCNILGSLDDGRKAKHLLECIRDQLLRWTEMEPPSLN